MVNAFILACSHTPLPHFLPVGVCSLIRRRRQTPSESALTQTPSWAENQVYGYRGGRCELSLPDRHAAWLASPLADNTQPVASSSSCPLYNVVAAYTNEDFLTTGCSISSRTLVWSGFDLGSSAACPFLLFCRNGRATGKDGVTFGYIPNLNKPKPSPRADGTPCIVL